MPLRVKSVRGWEWLGIDGLAKGRLPAAISPSWDGWGSSSLSFSIDRDPAQVWPDLAGGTPIEYVPPGGSEEPTWGGFINEKPAAGENGLNVQCLGLPFLLDDLPYKRMYVREDASSFVDARTIPNTDLSFWLSGWNVTTGALPTFSFPGPNRSTGGTSGGMVMIDLGTGGVCGRVSIDWERNGVWTGTAQAAVDASTGPGIPAGVGTIVNLVAAGANSGTISFTIGVPKRYVFIEVTSLAAQPAENWFRINGVRLYASTAYESGNQSILKASDVIKYALTQQPLLDQDVSEIAATTTNLRAFGGLEKRTPRAEMELANTYHRYLLRLTARGRLQYRARLDRATLEANTRRDGVEWNNASDDSIAEVYNRVVLTGKTGSGQELEVIRNSSDVGIRNVLDRAGRTRAKEIEVPVPTDSTILTLLADVWLKRYARTPLKGTLTVSGDALRDAINATGIPASQAGTRIGELVNLSNLIDPDTGDKGRVAITVGASYNEQTDQATIAIDNTRDDLDALLARMAAVQLPNVSTG